MKKLIISLSIALSLASCAPKKVAYVQVNSALYGNQYMYTIDSVKVSDSIKVTYNLAGETIATTKKNNSIGHYAVVTKIY